MFVDRLVREAELAFLNAPFNDGGWLGAISQLGAATGTAVTQLCGGGDDTDLTFNYFSGELHDPHAHLVNPLLYGPENWRFHCRMGGAGSIQYEADYAAYRKRRSTSFYDDAVSDLDLPFGCQSPLIIDAGGLIGLALLRSRREGPCTPEVLLRFSRIAVQAQRAVRVELALGQERGEQMLPSLTVNSESTILLDRKGRLVALTEAAEGLFDVPGGLRLDGLRVRFDHAEEDRRHDAALARLSASDGIDGPILHESVVGRCAESPCGRWRLFLTKLRAGRDTIGCEAQFALTLRTLPATTGAV